jgi:hypothetical protein
MSRKKIEFDSDDEDELCLELSKIKIKSKINFEDYLKNKIKEYWKINIDEVIEDSKKEKIPSYLNKKIINECNKKGFIYKDILLQIQNSKEYASFFAKDPLKQNIAEKTQIEYINKNTNKNIIKLPSAGPNSVFFKNGELIIHKDDEMNNSFKNTKTFDFKSLTVDNKIEYYYAKYTNEEGGAQDNQYKDAVSFIDQANLYYKKNKFSDIKFILILDGNYYIKKMNDIKKLINHSNILVETSTSLC